MLRSKNFSKQTVAVEYEAYVKNVQKEPAMCELLVPYGIDNDDFDQGIALCVQGFKENVQQVDFKNRQYGKNKELKKVHKEVCMHLTGHIKVLKLNLKKDTDMQTRLGLLMPRVFTPEKTIPFANSIYTNMLTNGIFRENNPSYPLPKAKIEEELQKVAELRRIFEEYEDLKASSRQATIRRDECYQKLETWILNFQYYCMLAFKNNPQFLEKAGLRKTGKKVSKNKPGDEKPAPSPAGTKTSNAGKTTELLD